MRGFRNVIVPGGGGAAQTVQTQSRFNLTVGGNSTSAGAGYALVSSGVLTLAGGNNITLSQNGNAITLSGAAAGGAQTAISGISVTDTMYTSGTVVFTGSNMVTVKSSGAGQTVIIDATQSVQSQNFVAVIGSGANGNGTFTSGTLSFKVGANITLSTGANVISIYGNSTQSVQTQNNVDVTLSGNSTSAGAGFALVSSGTLVLAGGNNITLSQNGQSVTILGVTTSAQQTGISSIAGSNTTYTSGMVVYTGSNMVTVKSSGAGQTLIFDATQSVQTQMTGLTAGMSTNGNTSGTTGLVSNQLVLAGGNNITLSQSVNGQSATITISQQLPYQRAYVPFAQNATQGVQWGNGLAKMQPFYAGDPVTASQVNQYVTLSVSSSSNSSFAGVMSFSVGIYSLNVSTWSLASSGSQSYQFSNTSSNSLSVITGVRRFTVPINVNMTPGYWGVAIWSLTSTTNANWFTASNIGVNGQASAFQGLFGVASNASLQFVPGAGYLNQSASFTTAMPATVHSSNIAGQGVAFGWAPYVDFQIDAY